MAFDCALKSCVFGHFANACASSHGTVCLAAAAWMGQADCVTPACPG
ncbi:MAG: hypothetical protein IKY83_09945 [Proteobacteria bacterium]|nr:hypothetical protein [Pseudomonadota bacterium]